METHGGYGRIWAQCYAGVQQGIVFEKKPTKCDALAKQRPTWAVYEGDCEAALIAGVGEHLPVNFLDLDPYGEPWPVVDAFFDSERPFPDTLAIAVNDGGLQFAKRGHAWKMKSIQHVVAAYGTEYIYNNYLDICQELLKEKASHRGYAMTRWVSYKATPDVAHYAAVLSKSS